ncbi:MAG: hypothetical protein JNK11_13990 [Alphaproteobacteria bacterium]|nr:hypothetical protein [Alphaproteobacteria bacterium]
MDFIAVVISGLNFFFTIAILVIVMNMAGAQKSQSMLASYLKNQLTFLYERLGELSDRTEKISDAEKQRIETFRTELIETIKTARLETLRENDDLKFLLKQLQNAQAPAGAPAPRRA